MKKAPILKDEINRLRTLIDYQILETAPEKDFDHIVTLAAQICGTPIALISLIEGDRQWFKAKVGVEAAESSREYSFCGHAIATSELMIITDATKDERFFDNPSVTGGPMVKFYAGAPLQSPSGHNIGALCIAGPTPRHLSPEQEDALRLLSKQVMILLEYRKKVLLMNAAIKKFQDGFEEFDLQQNDFMSAGKMETLSGLATGVAHEINNPLAIIMMTANLMRRKLASNEVQDLDEGLLRIEKTVLRVAGVVDELRNLSGMSPENFASGKTLESSFSAAVLKGSQHK